MTELIDKEEAKRLIEETQKIISPSYIDFDVEEKINSLNREKNNAQLALKEWNDVIRMRRLWSCWLLYVIIAIVIFDFFIIIASGFSWIHFNDNYTVPLFTGESLIKIFGLAIIVVRFLFNEKLISKK
jgi:hypothetical protein